MIFILLLIVTILNIIILTSINSKKGLIVYAFIVCFFVWYVLQSHTIIFFLYLFYLFFLLFIFFTASLTIFFLRIPTAARYYIFFSVVPASLFYFFLYVKYGNILIFSVVKLQHIKKLDPVTDTYITKNRRGCGLICLYLWGVFFFRIV